MTGLDYQYNIYVYGIQRLASWGSCTSYLPVEPVVCDDFLQNMRLEINPLFLFYSSHERLEYSI